jgi:hypothetical protein
MGFNKLSCLRAGTLTPFPLALFMTSLRLSDSKINIDASGIASLVGSMLRTSVGLLP